jgi:phosphoribosylformimino-5-aminoimidazole carboxamide ribotide isomerase
MLVIPSIDVRGGRAVRLLRGDYAQETVISDEPVAVVTSFADAGARRVHVVDLDSARGHADGASQRAAGACVASLAERGVEVQVGGGVRDIGTAQRWFDNGATAVVVGSLAVRDPAAAESLCAAFPGRVLVGLDVRDGVARAQGWTEPAGDALVHLARWASWPLAGIIHTAIERDGTLGGPAIDALRAVCRRCLGAVFASGGVTRLDDVAACQEAGAAGVIVGRALHEGLFDLHAALLRFGGSCA